MVHPTSLQIRIGIALALLSSLLCWGVWSMIPTPPLFVVSPSFSTSTIDHATPSPSSPPEEPIPLPSRPVLSSPSILPFGAVQMRLGETIHMPSMTMSVIKVLEDSRCPSDVMCVWAGILKVSMIVVEDGVDRSMDIALGETQRTTRARISFLDAVPLPRAGAPVDSSEMVFTFDIHADDSASMPPAKEDSGCVVAGCSSQLCMEAKDAEGMMSTCEYRESYACYATALCERQPTGVCEWTPTPALSACLERAEAEGVSGVRP